MTIKKVKILKSGVTIEYTEKEQEYKVESKVQPHPDFPSKINLLKEAFIKALGLDKDLDDVSVSGFEIKPEKDQDSLILTGTFKDYFGKSIGVATSKFNIEHEDFNDWDLYDITAEVITEASKYLEGSKKAQQEIEFPEEESSDN